jgi:hypothetical protein
MKLTCNEATTICDKSQYKEATFIELFKLKLHLFLCKKCGKYAKQNGILSKCFETKRKIDCTKNKCLCEDEKEAMDKQLKAKV